MTPEQAQWLRANRQHGYEAVGHGKKYARRGLLHPDGKYEEVARGQAPKGLRLGSFEVGVPAAPIER